jgi:methyl-accepting chemotaxis protein
VYAVPIKNNNEVVGVLIETRDGNELTSAAQILNNMTNQMIGEVDKFKREYFCN